MNTVVTGGSGYLGTHVRRRLGADSISRREGVDIRRRGGLGLLSGYDAVVHMAAHLDKSPRAADACFAVNVQGTLNVLRHLRPGQALVFLSTKDVYGRHAAGRRAVGETCPTSYSHQAAYEWSKLIAERYVDYYAHERNLSAAILRLSTTYAPPTVGNRGGFVNFFVQAIRSGAPIHLKARGRQVRDLLHVDDLARAIELFLESRVSGEIFNIGGGPENTTTLAGLVGTLETLIGRDAALDKSDEGEPGQMRYVSDIRKARTILGWAPRIGLKRGLRTVL